MVTMTSTTAELREKLLPKVSRDVVTDKLMGLEEGLEEGVRPGVKLCIERARLITESYKETEGEPMVIRRAKALEKILENMTIYIEEGQLIVGNVASQPDMVCCYPELGEGWLEEHLDYGLKNVLDEEEKAELKQIYRYWDKNSVHSKFLAALPKGMKRYLRTNAGMWGFHGHGVLTPNLEKAMAGGLNGLMAEAEERLRELDSDSEYIRLHAKDYVSQKNFLEAVKISLGAAIKFAARYAQKAREMAEVAKEPKEKTRLNEIARACDWVPANQPRTFHEALQFTWFIHIIITLLECEGAGSGLRLDVCLYPYYKKDVEEGGLTRDEAQTLMELFFLKFEGVGVLLPPSRAGSNAGDSLFQTLNIGGCDAEGNDVTNEVSYIVLDAAKAMQTRQPTLALRYSDKAPKELVYKAIDAIRTGIGYPALFNDKVIIDRLTHIGLSLEDARNYAIRGCVIWVIPGKNISDRGDLASLSLPKCLELALNQGRDKLEDGKQIGYPTPDPLTFESIDDILNAFRKQVSFFSEKFALMDNICEALYEDYLQTPFRSALIDSCIEKGKDLTAWRHFSQSANMISGPTNVADSLAAIKKFVFDEKSLAMAELLEMLDKDFEGYEDWQQALIHKAPKYGNDDDYVDSLAEKVHLIVTEESNRYPDYFGYPIWPDGSFASGPFAQGPYTGATADGRKAHHAFADAVLSPSAGRDLKGPTAVLKSASKIDPVKTYNHLLNQRFQPQFMADEYKEMFASFIKTWADLGVYHIQFNTVDTDTLRKAQKHPEEYQDLIVRVAGYSAYFVDLSKGLQDEIIKRTEQSFGC